MLTDILIIGGGIIGMTTALELKKQGLGVIIIDDETNTKASWAGAGIISPLYPWKYDDFVNKLSIKSQQSYPELCEEIKENSGIDPEYRISGLMMLDEFATKQAQDWLKKWQISYTKTDDGALFENIAQVRNPRIIKGLKIYLQKLGVKFINQKVGILDIKNNQVLGANNINAGRTIICGGAWSNKLIDIDIYPVKGEMIVVSDPILEIEHIYLKDGKYIVPRDDGKLIIGSTMQKVGFDNKLNKEFKQQLFDFATSIFPYLKTQPIIHHWCGFRPASNSIIIKQDEKYNNLFINTGHFRNGLNTAPQSAKIMIDLIIKTL